MKVCKKWTKTRGLRPFCECIFCDMEKSKENNFVEHQIFYLHHHISFSIRLTKTGFGKKFTQACGYYYGNNYSFNKFWIIEPSVLFQEWNGCREREMTSCLQLSTLLTILSCGTSTNKPSCGRKGSWTTSSTFSSILSITTK